MLLISGRRSRELVTKTIQMYCRNCHTSKQVLTILQPYFQIFWIPFFPGRKQAWVQCQHCLKVLEEKKVPAPEQSFVAQERSLQRTPLWTVSGWILLLALMLFGALNGYKEKVQTRAYAQNLQAGDTLVLKKKQAYFLLRVIDVSGDRVKFLLGKEVFNKSSEARKALKSSAQDNSYYVNDEFQLPRGELNETNLDLIKRNSI